MKEDVEPKTTKELYDAINALGCNVSFMSDKMFEELDGVRYTHKTYSIQSYSLNVEDLLVERLWFEIKDVFNYLGSNYPVIIWRRKPRYLTEDIFSDKGEWKGKQVSILSMRLSIGSDNGQSSFIPFTCTKEGENPVYLDA